MRLGRATYYDEMQNQFGNGKVGMMFMLDGVLPQLSTKFGDKFVSNKVGFFPYPSDKGEGTAMISPPHQLMVPKKAKHRDAAIELVKFMTSPQVVDLWYKEQPGIPIFKDAKSELYPVQRTVNRYIEEGKAETNIQNRLVPTFVDFPKVLQKMFISGDVDQAVKQFEENYVRDGRSKRLKGF